MASVSCDRPVCSDEHLESAWLWLSDVHDLMAGLRKGSPKAGESVSTWLTTAVEVPQAVCEQHRAGFALSLLRKAWKLSPLTHASPAELLGLFLCLLEPFAPILGWTLRQHLALPLRAPTEWCQAVGSKFQEYQLIHLQIDRGARHVVVVHTQEWQTNPLQALARCRTWAARLLSDPHWTLINQGETWLLTRSATRSKSDSSV